MLEQTMEAKYGATAAFCEATSSHSQVILEERTKKGEEENIKKQEIWGGGSHLTRKNQNNYV